PIGLFELSLIGAPAAVLVVGWFMVAGLRLMPDRGRTQSGTVASEINAGYQFDYKIPAESPLQGKTIEEDGLRALDTVFLIHAQRQKHIIAVGPGFIMEAGDILTFRGEHRQVHKIASAKKLIPAEIGRAHV